MARRNSTFITLELNIHYETEKAIRVSLEGDPSEGAWLAKSQIEWAELGQSRVEVTMPEWLALEKDLI